MTGPQLTEEEIRRLYAEYQAIQRQASRPTIQRAPSESTGTRATIKNATPEQVAANRQADASYAVGLLRQGAQVATAGFADEIEGGVRSVVQGRPYREARDQVRSENDAFAQEYPGTTLAANVLGGVATGMGAARLAQAPGMIGRAASVLAPRATATGGAMGAIKQAARVGGITGALGGAGVAEEMGDIPQSAAIGGVVGAGAGALFATAGEALRGTRNALGQAFQKGDEQGRIRRTVQAETPEQAAARRVLRAAGRGGQTLDDVAAASEAAPSARALGEVLNDDQGVGLMRISRNAGRRRDATDRALAERSAETPAMWARTVSRETGVPAPRDPVAVMNEARREALEASSPLYAKANALPDVVDDGVAEVAETLRAMPEFGPRAIRRAQTLAAARGETFPTTFRPDVPDGQGITVYHGSAKPITGAFDKSFLGDTTGADDAAIGFHFADDPANADFYAQMAARKAADPFDDPYNARGVVEKYTLYPKKPLVVDGDIADLLGDDKFAAARYASEHGHDAIIYPYGTSVDAGYTAIALDPKIIQKGGGAAKSLPTPVRNVLDLRRGLDEVLQEMQDAGESPALVRELSGMRARLDAIAKGAGEVVGEADEAYATPIRRGESFGMGTRVEQAATPEAVQRMAAEATDPEAFRQGVASKLLERAAGTADGEAGQTRNVVQGPLGSETRRARTRAAFLEDASFDRARADAEEIVRYLRTQRSVSGNSATLANLAELADEFGVEPATILQHATSPAQLALAIARDRGRALATGTVAAQADAMGRFVNAGLPGFGTRSDAVARLRELEPAIVQLMRRQATTRGAMAGATGRAAAGASQ